MDIRIVAAQLSQCESFINSMTDFFSAYLEDEENDLTDRLNVYLKGISMGLKLKKPK